MQKNVTFRRSLLLEALLITVLVFLVTPLQAQTPPSQVADTAGARGMVTGYVAAWNIHDMNALASLFAENAEFVNPMGRWASGRQAIEAEHTQRHSTIFQTSTMTADTMHIKFISPDVAVAHVQWTLTGMQLPNGVASQPFSGITSFVSRRSDGRWQIESGQVTIIAPEGTLPAAGTPTGR